MCNTDIIMSQIGKACYLGWFPLMLRDVSFRAVLLAFYYGLIDVEHKP